MFVLIVGGGKVGSHLAKTLATEGHQVTIIEVNSDRCAVLEDLMQGVRIICGDGDEPYVLDEADARNADALVAATGHDEDNLVVALLGKMEYDSPLTVGRINNPANAWLFTERFGVDVPVSNTAIMADVLKSVSLGDIVTMLRLQAENMVIDEIVLPAAAHAVGRKLSELALPEGSQVMVIVSAGSVVVPRGETVLSAGDELLILTKTEHEAELRRVFAANGGSR